MSPPRASPAPQSSRPLATRAHLLERPRYVEVLKDDGRTLVIKQLIGPPRVDTWRRLAGSDWYELQHTEWR